MVTNKNNSIQHSYTDLLRILKMNNPTTLESSMMNNYFDEIILKCFGVRMD